MIPTSSSRCPKRPTRSKPAGLLGPVVDAHILSRSAVSLRRLPKVVSGSTTLFRAPPTTFRLFHNPLATRPHLSAARLHLAPAPAGCRRVADTLRRFLKVVGGPPTICANSRRLSASRRQVSGAAETLRRAADNLRRTQTPLRESRKGVDESRRVVGESRKTVGECRRACRRAGKVSLRAE
jgi:hypothetical protein